MARLTCNTGSEIINNNEGIVVKGTAVEGGYFVTPSIAVTSTGEAGKIPNYACVTGALCYCTADSKFYQYNGTKWVEAELGAGGIDASELAAKFGTGNYSVVAGDNTRAIGIGSKATGKNTVAYGDYSTAEGESSEVPVDKNGQITSGILNSSNWQFYENVYTATKFLSAKGRAAHAEGLNTLADGYYSHTEGFSTRASNTAAHAEGALTVAIGRFSHAEGGRTYAHGDRSHAEGDIEPYAGNYGRECYLVNAAGTLVSQCSNDGVAYGNYSHREGRNTTTRADGSHAEGYGSCAGGKFSHAEGWNSSAWDYASHAEGWTTNANGEGAHAEGYYTRATGDGAHAEGYLTMAFGDYSHAAGYSTRTESPNQFVIGHYNRYTDSSSNTTISGTGTIANKNAAFIIGNGSGTSNKSNAFRVNYSGEVYGKGAYNSTGADYAEYFEWADSNASNEDRRGYFVTLENDKIKIAKPGDYILGIISGQPAILGNSDEEWCGRYLLDDFGAYILEEFEYEAEIPEVTTKEIVDEATQETITTTETTTKIVKRTGVRFKENPDYDPEAAYISRKDRAEWDAVGMMGVLSVIDDGSCQVNGYCTVAEDGTAVAADSGYRVIKRVNDHIVKVIFR